MLHAKPQGICSWNYFLEGNGHRASLDFNWLGEQGTITVDGTPMEIQKHGLFSAQWTLAHSGQQIATARKSSAFTRTFEMQTSDGTLMIRAESPFGRSFRVERSGDLIATIAPVHAFTRRATIEVLASDIDLAHISFSFWLVALMWRRAANNSAAASG